MVDVPALYREGLALHREGDLAGAEERYRRILDRDAAHSGALHFLGVVHLARKDLVAAIDHLERAVDFRSDKSVYHNNYGVALKEVGRLEDATSAFRKAVELDPDYADALSNLGLVLLFQDHFDEAERRLRKALELRPDHADARRHLADLLLRRGSLARRNRHNDKASKDFEQAVRLFPENAATHLSLGATQADRGEFDAAELSFQKAASLPRGKKLWTFKRLGFCPTVFEDESQIEEYWSNLDGELDRLLDDPPPMDWRTLPQDGFTPSFNLPHLNKCCRNIKEKFAAIFRNSFPEELRHPVDGPRLPGRIRVGFLVTSGHHHGFFRVYGPILDGLDPKRFEVFLFAPTDIADECRRELRSNHIKCVPFPRPFDLAVSTIRNFRCDIIYHWKVGGGPSDYFLPFAKPAPVQCTSYGTHGTGGVEAVDWYLSSSIIEAPTADEHYTEKLHRFPCFPTWHTQALTPIDVKRSEFPVPDRGTLYFCPHRIPKYHPMFDWYLREILERDGNGTVLMRTGHDEGPRDRLRRRLSRHLGAKLMERVVFFAELPHEIYLRLMALCDVVLDSPVYSGDLTTHDAFSYGKPVVTQRGELLVQRYTSGLCDSMGIKDLVANNRSEYIDIVVRLGLDAEYRRDVSRHLANSAEHIFDNVDLIREFESFLESSHFSV